MSETILYRVQVWYDGKDHNLEPTWVYNSNDIKTWEAAVERYEDSKELYDKVRIVEFKTIKRILDYNG